MAASLESSWLTVNHISGIKSEDYENVPMDDVEWNLPSIGVGCVTFRELRPYGNASYSSSDEGPIVTTPFTGGHYAVWVISKDNYRMHAKNGVYAPKLLFLGVFQAGEEIFTMSGVTTYVMYARID